ncbi:MAG TPA: hypothetical protein VF615_11230 [Longimicrobiaceae bacterium]|jgi:hypothetical protein
MNKGSIRKRRTAISSLFVVVAVAACAATTAACGVDVSRGPGESADGQRFSASSRPRRFREVEWRVLWERGGTESDSVFLMPSELSTDGRHVYVYDMATDHLLALRAADGSLAWKAGRRGSGPQEFRKAEDVAFGATGDLMVADPNNNRISLLNPEGKVSSQIPLDAVPYAVSTCSLADGQVLVSTLGSLTPPIIRLSADGKVLAQSHLPWPDLKNSPGIVQQGFFVRTRDGKCIYMLALGRGFTVYDGAGFQPAMPYVESFDLPPVELTPGEKGAPPSTRILDRTEAAVGAGADEGTLAVGFWGKTKDQGELIDLYSLDRGEYLHSFLAPVVFTRLARAGSVYFFESRRDGYPVLIAAELREKQPGR